ncbi:MAG: Na(+)-translocating NADH-quinone reductase subunit A [Paracoccus sp. (in: a-proteobacteria)]|nr:Na(+)-translocating NADH-quinone reductase subunit A [Paracoccus sp. (in: a-proteobacteria)]
MKHLLQKGLEMRPGGPELAALHSPAAVAEAETLITPEAIIGPGLGRDFRVDMLVEPDAVVAQGDALAQSRRDPRLVLSAPMAGRVARIDLGPGRRLERIEIFSDDSGRQRQFDTSAADTAPGLRALMLDSGLWVLALRSRPGGGLADPDVMPAAIFVAAAETRPGALAPRLALAGQMDEFRRGLDALALLTGGEVHLVQDDGTDLVPAGGRLRIHRAGGLHPAGLIGGHIHHIRPALPGRPVWQIEAQDVAALGALILTGHLPPARLVSVAGPGLARARLVRTQPGADMRALVQGALTPGPKMILSGDALAGQETRHLMPGARLVTAMPRPAAGAGDHWFRAALGRAARPVPLIPSAAVEQSLPAGIPAVPLLRALGAGDDEAAIRLGALSLVEEDLALADYITAAHPRFAALIRALLERTAIEEGA